LRLKRHNRLPATRCASPNGPSSLIAARSPRIKREIIDAPTTSVVDIVVKLEIIAKESEIFGDVSERLNQLRDQIAKFADGNVIRLIGRDDYRSRKGRQSS
jgi:hypothetical protein